MARGGQTLSPKTLPARKRLALPEAKPSLDVNTASELVAQAQAGNWEAVCQGLRTSSFPDEASQDLRDSVLDVLAENLTPTYHQRWNKQLGQFLAALGLIEEDQPAEAYLGTKVGERPVNEVAIDLARRHLDHSAQRGHSFSTNFTKENCSTGYRNAYLSQLRRLGETDGTKLIEQVAKKTGLDDKLAQLIQENGSLEKVAASLEWDVWMKCWWCYQKAKKKKEPLAGGRFLLESLEEKLAAPDKSLLG